MTFGVTTQGFSAKRLNDIKTELEDAFKSAFGISIDLDPDAPFGQIIGIFAERESEVWELAEAVYNSQYPLTAEGINLDNVAAITGVTRNPATKSTAIVKATGTEGTLIPTGSVISKENDPLTRFVTDSDATIGAGINEIQKAGFNLDPDSGDFKFTFNGNESGVIQHNDNAATIQVVLEALTGIGAGNVLVSGAINDVTGLTITFQGALAEQDVSALTVTSNNLLDGVTPVVTTVTEDTQGSLPFVNIPVSGENEGPFTGPSGSLNVIEGSITGWDAVTNALDAEVGREVETDADLKIRRENALQVAGSGTTDAIRSQLLLIDTVTAVIVFENTSITPDGDGRPPKSFESVVQGGDDVEIAETILATKPAGIETHGSITETVQDSQGFDIDIKFSRPTEIDIHLEIDLVVNTEEYPVNGDDLAEAALLAFGNALQIGEDVIVYPQLICALNDIPGIRDIVVRIGTAVSPTLDDNIVIAPNEISSWDSSRITVTVP